MKFRYMIFMGIMALMLTIILLPDAIAKNAEIVLEAELANKIVAPMVIAVPADAKAQGGAEPNDPSNGKFVWTPGKPVEGGANGNKGWVEYIIQIPEDGEYAVWAWVVAWDGNSDSFWVVWEPVDPFENPQQTNNLDYRWSVSNGNTWHWDRIEAWKADDSHVDRVWEFDKGTITKLYIFCREDATMLDALYITDDLVGGQANARLPEDADREAQIKGVIDQAVDGRDKLSASWGRIKTQY